EAAFFRDLDEKDGVLLARDQAGRVRGFSTYQRFDGVVGGRRYVAMFSGDTIMDREHWGDLALHRGYFGMWITLRRQVPLVPLFWSRISKGYKPYWLLTRNFPTHYPGWDRATPVFEQGVVAQVATRKFGSAYCPADGVIRYANCLGRL